MGGEDRLVIAIERLLPFMISREWEDSDAVSSGYCGYCNRYRNQGHKEDCQFVEVLSYVQNVLENRGKIMTAETKMVVVKMIENMIKSLEECKIELMQETTRLHFSKVLEVQCDADGSRMLTVESDDLKFLVKDGKCKFGESILQFFTDGELVHGTFRGEARQENGCWVLEELELMPYYPKMH